MIVCNLARVQLLGGQVHRLETRALFTIKMSIYYAGVSILRKWKRALSA